MKKPEGSTTGITRSRIFAEIPEGINGGVNLKTPGEILERIPEGVSEEIPGETGTAIKGGILQLRGILV